eukprot:c16617_g1_i1.p1 GENE.c16617_g1_i1~~c16617_g1_i1.p1  ORF type:complete len:177 (+),score=88.13 c16617_g1_i1:22-552(+)
MAEENKGKKPIGNGDVLEKYSWTQKLEEVSVNIPIPSGTRAKQLNVEFFNNRLKVGLKGQTPIIDGEVFAALKVEDCTWTIADDNLAIELSKSNKQQWWKYLVKGDPEIDTSKIEPENSKIDDLDPEAQQLVRKMMFDQRQKQMGLPTSEELQKQEMLQKFQQQHPEFDFSNAKIN